MTNCCSILLVFAVPLTSFAETSPPTALPTVPPSGIVHCPPLTVQDLPNTLYADDLGTASAHFSLRLEGAVMMQKSAQSLLANTNFWTVALGVLGAGFTIDTLKGGIDAIRSKF